MDEMPTDDEAEPEVEPEQLAAPETEPEVAEKPAAPVKKRRRRRAK